MAICPSQKNPIFVLVRSKVLDRIVFTAQKKAIFHLCLIVCPILIGPLSSCPILCHLQVFWRTNGRSTDFLSAPREATLIKRQTSNIILEKIGASGIHVATSKFFLFHLFKTFIITNFWKKKRYFFQKFVIIKVLNS
jgi:hypothetical protein